MMSQFLVLEVNVRLFFIRPWLQPQNPNFTLEMKKTDYSKNQIKYWNGKFLGHWIRKFHQILHPTSIKAPNREFHSRRAKFIFKNRNRFFILDYWIQKFHQIFYPIPKLCSEIQYFTLRTIKLNKVFGMLNWKLSSNFLNEQN